MRQISTRWPRNPVREFALSLSPVVLTSVQSWRIIGFSFLLLEARSVLPAVFAWPAGYGDLLIGVTAAYAAWKLAYPMHRDGFIFWQRENVESCFEEQPANSATGGESGHLNGGFD
jgi:hypothetical protein